MTRRIYHENGALRCTARVLECKAEGEGYAVLTDATVIFPESGGQLSDQGSIAGIAVSHAREEGEDVWHLTAAPIEAGREVEILADSALRLDHSQQHSGEHILSGLAYNLFGARNVGFHMAEDYATIDLDTFLEPGQIKELQRAANRAVQANLPVTCRVVQGEELTAMELRKKASGLTGDVRIVYVDEGRVDSCTCCGTHVDTTGQVGYIKITSHMKYKGGVRLWFACGMRAVEDSLLYQDIVDGLAVRFSVKPADLPAAVHRQGEELHSARGELRERTEGLLRYIAQELHHGAEEIKGVRLTVSLQHGMAMKELKLLSEKLTADPNALAVIFGTAGDSLQYQLARGEAVKHSMRDIIQAVNAAAGGKGGGREAYAQGSAPVTPAMDVEGTVEQIRAYLRAALRG